jgi:hypothetical protein
MRRGALVIFLVLPGVAAMAVCGYYLLLDWAQLNAAHAQFEALVRNHAELRALFVKDAIADMHRLNCFAEGVGFLLGGILAGLGIHGLCLLPGRSRQP